MGDIERRFRVVEDDRSKDREADHVDRQNASAERILKGTILPTVGFVRTYKGVGCGVGIPIAHDERVIPRLRELLAEMALSEGSVAKIGDSKEYSVVRLIERNGIWYAVVFNYSKDWLDRESVGEEFVMDTCFCMAQVSYIGRNFTEIVVRAREQGASQEVLDELTKVRDLVAILLYSEDVEDHELVEIAKDVKLLRARIGEAAAAVIADALFYREQVGLEDQRAEPLNGYYREERLQFGTVKLSDLARPDYLGSV